MENRLLADHLGGDGHEIRAFLLPRPPEPTAHRQAEAQKTVTWDRQAGMAHLVIGQIFRDGAFGSGLVGAMDGDAMAPGGQTAGHLGEGHGDTVDLRREGFGDERELQLAPVASVRRGWGEAKTSQVWRYHFLVT